MIQKERIQLCADFMQIKGSFSLDGFVIDGNMAKIYNPAKDWNQLIPIMAKLFLITDISSIFYQLKLDAYKRIKEDNIIECFVLCVEAIREYNRKNG